MANEATILCSLTIRKGKLEYSSLPASFRVNVVSGKGPTPGVVTVDTNGTDINLTELASFGLCRFMNLDSVNFVEYGVGDPETDRFYTLGEIRPGESYVLRLSRNLREEYWYGTGSGTGEIAPGGTNTLRFRADTLPCNVLVEVFEA